MTDPSDIAIAEALKKGDEHAFEEIFRKYYRQLVYFANGIVANDQEAEDIVIETMSRLWTHHEKFGNLLQIRSFLYITTRNQCFNYLRSQKTRNEYSTAIRHLEEAGREEYVLAKMVKLELFEMIRKEIEALPPQRRTVLMLSFFKDLSVKEIAETLHLSPNTVLSTRAQAIQQLRNILFKKKL